MLKQIVLCWDDYPMLEPRVSTRANATSKSVGAGSYGESPDSRISTPESRLQSHDFDYSQQAKQKPPQLS